jgi:hypothetical protein
LEPEAQAFQGFQTAAMIAEIAMVGMVAIRLKPAPSAFVTIGWDSDALKVKGEPKAEAIVELPVRKKWL